MEIPTYCFVCYIHHFDNTNLEGSAQIIIGQQKYVEEQV